MYYNKKNIIKVLKEMVYNLRDTGIFDIKRHSINIKIKDDILVYKSILLYVIFNCYILNI